MFYCQNACNLVSVPKFCHIIEIATLLMSLLSKYVFVIIIIIITLIANVDVSVEFWIGVIRHPHDNTRI